MPKHAFFFQQVDIIIVFLNTKKEKKREKNPKNKTNKRQQKQNTAKKKRINTTGITKTVKKQQQKLKTKTKNKTKGKAFLIYSFMETKYKMNINKLT